MMWADLATAVIARLTADATLLAMLTADSPGAKIGTEEMVQRTEAMYPYISIGLDAAAQSDGFRIDGLLVDFTVHIHALTSGGVVAVSDISKRVYGDAAQQASFAPTFGLHRWLLGTVGSSPWAFSAPIVIRTDGYQENDEFHYNEVHRFRCDLTKAS